MAVAGMHSVTGRRVQSQFREASYQMISQGKEEKTFSGTGFIRIAGFALVYFIAHQIAFFFPDSEKVIMAVWPAGGIGLAAFLLTPYRLWPGLVLGFYLAGVMADVFLANRSLGAGLGYMTGNMVESLGCALLIIRCAGKRVRFDRVIEVLALIASVLLVNAFSSCIGAASGVLSRGISFWDAWLSWFISDGLGILLVTPLIITGVKSREIWPWYRPGWGLESGLFILTWILAVWQSIQPASISRPLTLHPYMLIAILAWPALSVCWVCL